MPKIGDIATGYEIGLGCGNKFIWVTCPDCKGKRWVKLCKGKPVSVRCRYCEGKRRYGKNNSQWKGGGYKHPDGYVIAWIEPASPFSKMGMYYRGRNYILEHRLIMAKHLGRCLKSWEIVHHKNHIRDDNRLKNLGLLKISDHNIITKLEEENKKLKKEIQELRGRKK